MKKSVNFKPIGWAVLASSLLITAPTAQAETTGFKNYVTDSIEIPFRSGPSYKHKISRMIRSGTPVTILEVNDEQWARMEYSDNRGRKFEGWMPSSLLQNQPVAKVQLEKELQKSAQLEQTKIQLTEEIDTLKSRLETTQNSLNTVNKEMFEIKQEYKRLKEVSGDSVAIGDENLILKQQVQDLTSQNTLYKKQISQAEDVVERQWFLTGGGVLLLGIILGLIFRTPSRKKTWSSF